MFTKLQMTNFKSWQETNDIRLAPLTGFFGTNSSGKSSLLQMLLLLKQTTESNDRNLVLKTGSLQEGYVNLGTSHEITFGKTTDMQLSLEWELADTGSGVKKLQIQKPNSKQSIDIQDLLQFTTTIHAESQRTFVKTINYHHDRFDVVLERQRNNRYTIRINVDGEEPNRPHGRPRVYMKPQKCYGFSDEALRYYQDTDYLSDIVLLFEQQFQRLHYLGPIREYPQRTYIWGGEHPTNVGLKGELAVAAIIAAKNEKQRVYQGRGKQPHLEERIASWLVELGLAHSFETRPLVRGGSQYEVRIKRHEHSPEVLITDLGIGVSQILPVLVLCYYVDEGSTIILEQPELHLHPSVQSGLADVFIDVIQKRNVQIILESHSEHLLRRLQRRIAEGDLGNEQTSLYFCDIEKGASTIAELDIDDSGNILNWPNGFFGDMTSDMLEMAQAGIKKRYNA